MAGKWRCLCGAEQDPRYTAGKGIPFLACPGCWGRYFANSTHAYAGLLAFTRLLDELEAAEPGAWKRMCDAALAEAMAERGMVRQPAEAPAPTPTTTKELAHV